MVESHFMVAEFSTFLCKLEGFTLMATLRWFHLGPTILGEAVWCSGAYALENTLGDKNVILTHGGSPVFLDRVTLGDLCLTLHLS